jgi:hypothetical protein
MPELVENAGPPLSAGWLSRHARAMGLGGGVDDVGGRDVTWELAGDALSVAHATARGGNATVRYAVALLYTGLPSGGSRWWWSCPACRARVDALYLPPGRDRLACRRCCRLLYGSQYPGLAAARKSRRPAVVVTREVAVWTPATGWVVTSRRTPRR